MGGERVSEASYVGLTAKGGLGERAQIAKEALRECRLCPHECGVDRAAGQVGQCRTGLRAVVASAGPHLGEEAPLVGRYGSGTIFFTHCNLSCVFCQNADISQLGGGVPVEANRLAALMLSLQERGCHNINFVTPTHVVPQILEALTQAVARGLRVPLVYNCGGYESVSTLELLDGIFDIYMPDAKYADAEVAKRLSGIPEYPEANQAALVEMHRQVGDLTVSGTGVAVRGLLVRHLVLPNGLAGTSKVMRFLANEVSRDTYVNIMGQYHPCHDAYSHPDISRHPSREEMAEAFAVAREAGLHRFDR